MLETLRFRYHFVKTVDDLAASLAWAYQTLAAGQCSVALVAEPELMEALRQ